MVVDIRIGDRSITDSYNHWTDSTIDWRSTEFQLIATDCKLAKLIPPWQMILTTILFLVVGYLGSIDNFKESVNRSHYELQIGQYRSSEFSISIFKMSFFSHDLKIII